MYEAITEWTVHPLPCGCCMAFRIATTDQHLQLMLVLDKIDAADLAKELIKTADALLEQGTKH